MFSVNTENRTIEISRGDTGAVRIHANAKYKGTNTPYTFGERDRALFTIKDQSGQIVKQRVYQIVQNTFTVMLFNADTGKMIGGTYNWDVRYMINPHYETGNPIPVDGDQVVTPMLPASVNPLAVVGDI